MWSSKVEDELPPCSATCHNLLQDWQSLKCNSRRVLLYHHQTKYLVKCEKEKRPFLENLTKLKVVDLDDVNVGKLQSGK